MVAGGLGGLYYPGSGTAVATTVCCDRFAGENTAVEKLLTSGTDGSIDATVFYWGEPDSSGSPFVPDPDGAVQLVGHSQRHQRRLQPSTWSDGHLCDRKGPAEAGCISQLGWA